MYAFFVVMGILCIFAAGKTKISMKYLIVSDIHGSLPALEKVLAFYEREHCDMLCLLGDVLNYGPRNGLPEGLDPQGVAKVLNAMAHQVVRCGAIVTPRSIRCYFIFRFFLIMCCWWMKDAVFF